MSPKRSIIQGALMLFTSRWRQSSAEVLLQLFLFPFTFMKQSTDVEAFRLNLQATNLIKSFYDIHDTLRPSFFF